MSIQAIDRSSVHRLTSGQVVIDLQTAVKELVENALDAGATSIGESRSVCVRALKANQHLNEQVKFKEHGVDAIEVQDNGKGINQSDWEGIARKHHTSKLSSFADLSSVSTLGFRGEALSSLCGTASLSLITATASTAPVGTSLTFSRSGECIVGGKVARPKGTTVKVERLFENLPVRRKVLIKDAKKEFQKALELVQAYAIVSTGVRFEVKNVTKGKNMTHLQTPVAPSVRSTFSCIFAPKSLTMLMDLDLTLDVAADKSVLKWSESGANSVELIGCRGSSTIVKVKGLISKPTAGHGRSSGSRQFFYINGRPFQPVKIAKAVNEVYKNYVAGSYPTVVADFQLATDAYDVNVSPDKRTIFLHSEGNLIAALKGAGAANKAAKSSPLQSEEDVGNDEEEGEAQMEERPKKRRKTGDAEKVEEEQPAEAGEEADDAPQPDHPVEGIATPPDASVDIPMEVEVDASFLAFESAHHCYPLPDPFSGDAFDDSGDMPELPQPALGFVPETSTRASEKVKGKGKAKEAPQLKPGSMLRHLQKFVRGGSQIPTPVDSEDYESDEAVEAGKQDDELEDDEGAAADSVIDDPMEQPQADGSDDNDDDQGMFIDENSFKAPAAVEGSDDELEIVAASCACVHGTPLVHDYEEAYVSDLEVEVPATTKEEGHPAVRLPFGSALAEVAGTVVAVDTTLDFDFSAIEACWTAPCAPIARPSASQDKEQDDALAGAGVGEEDDDAEATLSRVVSKDDFGAMEVVGQFNLGFIIARRRVGMGGAGAKGKEFEDGTDEGGIDGAGGVGEMQDDLFIIDQHASDEKYNFEKLQAETVIQSQRLLAPRVLNLPSHDEITAMEHLELLRLNGYDVLVDEDADIGERVKLTAQPVSKDTVFDVGDFEELLDLIGARSSNEVVRPSKTRRMFASRACRKSVMIGKALNAQQMTSVRPPLPLARQCTAHGLLGTDRPAHGRDGPTLGLSSWSSYDALVSVSFAAALFLHPASFLMMRAFVSFASLALLALGSSAQQATDAGAVESALSGLDTASIANAATSALASGSGAGISAAESMATGTAAASLTSQYAGLISSAEANPAGAMPLLSSAEADPAISSDLAAKCVVPSRVPSCLPDADAPSFLRRLTAVLGASSSPSSASAASSDTASSASANVGAFSAVVGVASLAGAATVLF
ncbi:SPOSA6832_02942 [Sporobolomyces salmonicolor]|uniref:SPOSA6832_02942-mRNA-1:cds n=1 Tax=Sporidiobolus salmonicolor TaxID=5005 RepID=A0A0D6ENE5_SPOSA|nr:SPOSA6832_02942 [Sporobolomyces salmonicolor]